MPQISKNWVAFIGLVSAMVCTGCESNRRPSREVVTPLAKDPNTEVITGVISTQVIPALQAAKLASLPFDVLSAKEDGQKSLADVFSQIERAFRSTGMPNQIVGVGDNQNSKNYWYEIPFIVESGAVGQFVLKLSKDRSSQKAYSDTFAVKFDSRSFNLGKDSIIRHNNFLQDGSSVSSWSFDLANINVFFSKFYALQKNVIDPDFNVVLTVASDRRTVAVSSAKYTHGINGLQWSSMSLAIPQNPDEKAAFSINYLCNGGDPKILNVLVAQSLAADSWKMYFRNQIKTLVDSECLKKQH